MGAHDAAASADADSKRHAQASAAPPEEHENGPLESPPRRPWRRRILVAALVVVLPTVILGGAWRLGGASALEDDLIYYLPIRQYIGECIRAGEWPLWNPLTMMGTSIAADPQSGLWYPPTWLFAVLPPLVAYPLTLISHFALAGAGMYRFLRASRHDWRAALLGAIAFEFCGYLVAHRAHLTILQAAAWLPWILVGWQRFAASRRYRHVLLATAALGVQMLVQHIQVSMITVALVTGYVAVVLWPSCRRMVWAYPLSLMLAVGVAAVQIVPTYLQFAGSARGAPSYSLFIENSWVPTSAVMLVFPMLFGSRTPNFWTEPWWGISHFCEQSVYGSILVLALAIASAGLLIGRTVPPQMRRACRFWWVAGLVAVVLALGEFTPVSKWLFHLPVYRNFRVPARWTLVVSVAMPVLASCLLTVLLRGGHAADRLRRWVRATAIVGLPLLTTAGVAVMMLARSRVDALAAKYGHHWSAERVLEGLQTAIHPANPAIWWPILLVATTAVVLARWARVNRRRLYPILLCLMIVDLTSVAAFVDVDVRTYQREDLTRPSPLARAIHEREPGPGDRLLVPRLYADYERPIEVLWPYTNLRHDIATFNGYGPFWPIEMRMLTRFMPWGATDGMLELLFNCPLLRQLGVRFIAVRTEQERKLLAMANIPITGSRPHEAITGSETMTRVRYGDDIVWPVELPEPGVYELVFQAAPVADSPSRWYLRLEDMQGREIGWTRTLVPADLALGERQLRFLFPVEHAVGPARVRIKAQMGEALSVGKATFRLATQWPNDRMPTVESTFGPRQHAQGALNAGTFPDPLKPPFQHRADLLDGVSIYELNHTAPLMHWAEGGMPVNNLVEAVEARQHWMSGATVVTLPPESDGEIPGLAQALLERGFREPGEHEEPIEIDRPTGSRVEVRTDSPLGGLLVFNESYDQGWKATVDGEPATLLRVNAVVQGVIVPPGAHRVVFRYRPAGLTVGATVSLMSVLALVVTAIATRGRRRA